MIIDRTFAPPLQQISKPSYIKPNRLQLLNAIEIYATKAGREEMIRIDWVFRAGSWYQDKALIANLTCAMLQVGSSKHNSKEIAEIFDFHGAYIQTSCAHHHAVISLICLKKHLIKLLPVVEDLIKYPSFPEKELNSLLARRRQRFAVEMEKVKTLCQKAFAKALFGTNHPYNGGVKLEDFDCIELSDLKSFYHKYYNANNCEIQLVGQYDDETISLLNQYFGSKDWQGEASQTVNYPIISSSNNMIRVNKPDAIQSAIRVGKRIENRFHPDYFDLKITTALLGGYFGSRLMSNIREDKGYTYGIGAGYVTNPEAGYFLIATEVDKQYEEATLKEIQFEISRLQNEPVDKEELHTLKQYLVGEFLRNFDGAFQQMAAFRNLHNFGLDYTHYDKYFEHVASITPEAIQRVSQQYLQLNSLITVIAGC